MLAVLLELQILLLSRQSLAMDVQVPSTGSYEGRAVDNVKACSLRVKRGTDQVFELQQDLSFPANQVHGGHPKLVQSPKSLHTSVLPPAYPSIPSTAWGEGGRGGGYNPKFSKPPRACTQVSCHQFIPQSHLLLLRLENPV